MLSRDDNIQVAPALAECQMQLQQRVSPCHGVTVSRRHVLVPHSPNFISSEHWPSQIYTYYHFPTMFRFRHRRASPHARPMKSPRSIESISALPPKSIIDSMKSKTVCPAKVSDTKSVFGVFSLPRPSESSETKVVPNKVFHSLKQSKDRHFASIRGLWKETPQDKDNPPHHQTSFENLSREVDIKPDASLEHTNVFSRLSPFSRLRTFRSHLSLRSLKKVDSPLPDRQPR